MVIDELLTGCSIVSIVGVVRDLGRMIDLVTNVHAVIVVVRAVISAIVIVIVSAIVIVVTSSVSTLVTVTVTILLIVLFIVPTLFEQPITATIP